MSAMTFRLSTWLGMIVAGEVLSVALAVFPEGEGQPCDDDVAMARTFNRYFLSARIG